MSGVSSRLLEQVHQHPAEVDRWLVCEQTARLVQARRRRDDRVDASPRLAIERSIAASTVSCCCAVSCGWSMSSPAKRRVTHRSSAPAMCFINQSNVVPLSTSGRRAAASPTPLTFRTSDSRWYCSSAGQRLSLAALQPRRLLVRHLRIVGPLCATLGHRPAMRLTPRYDGPAVLQFPGAIRDLSVPLLRQRRRLGALLSGLDDAQWATASRCEKWSVRDVIAHLVGADQFWVLSAAAALAACPNARSRHLRSGGHPRPDGRRHARPVAHPGPLQLLGRGRRSRRDPHRPRRGPVVSTGRGAAWPRRAAPHGPPRPLGPVDPRSAIVLPLGMTPVEEPDEVLACLEYSAALSRRSSLPAVRPDRERLSSTAPILTPIWSSQPARPSSSATTGRAGRCCAPRGTQRRPGRGPQLARSVPARHRCERSLAARRARHRVRRCRRLSATTGLRSRSTHQPSAAQPSHRPCRRARTALNSINAPTFRRPALTATRSARQ